MIHPTFGRITLTACITLCRLGEERCLQLFSVRTIYPTTFRSGTFPYHSLAFGVSHSRIVPFLTFEANQYYLTPSSILEAKLEAAKNPTTFHLRISFEEPSPKCGKRANKQYFIPHSDLLLIFKLSPNLPLPRRPHGAKSTLGFSAGIWRCMYLTGRGLCHRTLWRVPRYYLTTRR